MRLTIGCKIRNQKFTLLPLTKEFIEEVHCLVRRNLDMIDVNKQNRNLSPVDPDDDPDNSNDELSYSPGSNSSTIDERNDIDNDNNEDLFPGNDAEP